MMEPRVEVLTTMMRGGKKPRKIKREDPCVLLRRAKQTLAAYAKWARDDEDLTTDQKRALGELVGEWRCIKEGCPGHDRLRALHGGVARHGPGDFNKWRSYIAACRQLEATTDNDGNIVQEVEPEEQVQDEAYEPRKPVYTVEDIERAVQKDWSVKKERDARAKEVVKISEFEQERTENLAERRSDRVAAGKLAIMQTKKTTTKTTDDEKPATLDGYSYCDDATMVVLYLDLTRPARVQDLEVNIKSKHIHVLHRGTTLIKRKWQGIVDPNGDETTWYLEDGGTALRIEVTKKHDGGFVASSKMKQPDYFDLGEDEKVEEADEDQRQMWPCVFEGDPPRWNRTTKNDGYAWSQTPTQITVTATVQASSAHDVAVTIRRDSLRIYVKKSGILLDGVLNRAINVGESTWFIESGGKLTVVLTKLEDSRAWQRLLAGRGDDHNVLDAHDDLYEFASDDIDLPKFDDMDLHDKHMILKARQFHTARAQNNFDLADELLEEINDFQPKYVQADLDRSHRDYYEDQLKQHDRHARALQDL